MIWSIHMDRVYGNMFKESKVSWPRAKRGFLVLQQRFPESRMLTSEFCRLASLAGDRSKTKQLLAKLDGKFDQSVWRDKKAYIRDWEWAFGK